MPGLPVQLCKHSLALQLYGHLLEQHLAQRSAPSGDLQLDCLEPGLWQLHDFTTIIGFVQLKDYPDPLPCTFASPADAAAFARWLADHPGPPTREDQGFPHPTPANGYLVAATGPTSREQWEAYFVTGDLPALSDRH